VDPEEFLRTLVEADITARDESNPHPDAVGGIPCHQVSGYDLTCRSRLSDHVMG
jgi:hypothetical protein